MDIVFILLPASLLLGAIAGGAYIWATRSGQFDDLDTPALRMLADEEKRNKEEDPTKPRD